MYFVNNSLKRKLLLFAGVSVGVLTSVYMVFFTGFVEKQKKL